METKTQTRNQTKIKTNFLDVVTLIRSIQRAEGTPDCYRREAGECERLDCVWRNHCIGEEDSATLTTSRHVKSDGKEPS